MSGARVTHKGHAKTHALFEHAAKLGNFGVCVRIRGTASNNDETGIGAFDVLAVPGFSFHNALLGESQEARMQIHSRRKVELDSGKRLLQRLQFAWHIVLGMGRGKEQHGYHDNALRASRNTGLDGFDNRRPGKFQVSIIQTAPPKTLTHQRDKLPEFIEAVGIPTPMSG
jgi:hypothetical protein